MRLCVSPFMVSCAIIIAVYTHIGIMIGVMVGDFTDLPFRELNKQLLRTHYVHAFWASLNFLGEFLRSMHTFLWALVEFILAQNFSLESVGFIALLVVPTIHVLYVIFRPKPIRFGEIEEILDGYLAFTGESLQEGSPLQQVQPESVPKGQAVLIAETATARYLQGQVTRMDNVEVTDTVIERWNKLGIDYDFSIVNSGETKFACYAGLSHCTTRSGKYFIAKGNDLNVQVPCYSVPSLAAEDLMFFLVPANKVSVLGNPVVKPHSTDLPANVRVITSAAKYGEKFGSWSTFGRLDRDDVTGCCRFTGSTISGYSGAGYYASNAWVGIHRGHRSGLNFGFLAAYVKTVKNVTFLDKAVTGESDTELARLLGLLREDGPMAYSKLSKRKSGDPSIDLYEYNGDYFYVDRDDVNSYQREEWQNYLDAMQMDNETEDRQVRRRNKSRRRDDTDDFEGEAGSVDLTHLNSRGGAVRTECGEEIQGTMLLPPPRCDSTGNVTDHAREKRADEIALLLIKQKLDRLSEKMKQSFVNYTFEQKLGWMKSPQELWHLTGKMLSIQSALTHWIKPVAEAYSETMSRVAELTPWEEEAKKKLAKSRASYNKANGTPAPPASFDPILESWYEATEKLHEQIMEISERYPPPSVTTEGDVADPEDFEGETGDHQLEDLLEILRNPTQPPLTQPLEKEQTSRFQMKHLSGAPIVKQTAAKSPTTLPVVPAVISSGDDLEVGADAESFSASQAVSHPTEDFIERSSLTSQATSRPPVLSDRGQRHASASNQLETPLASNGQIQNDQPTQLPKASAIIPECSSETTSQMSGPHGMNLTKSAKTSGKSSLSSPRQESRFETVWPEKSKLTSNKKLVSLLTMVERPDWVRQADWDKLINKRLFLRVNLLTDTCLQEYCLTRPSWSHQYTQDQWEDYLQKESQAQQLVSLKTQLEKIQQQADSHKGSARQPQAQKQKKKKGKQANATPVAEPTTSN
ncbi:hypothetical protein 1 [Beihai sobemo-like virus 21]|uniref:hypothetical protein 1 n=1 Tax=Beihai sobemo-like virus 21 TaxID=1922693 RepID=UPI00090BA632|nr:hypothetical protein 1 [Beihai sobemo-like virus 21]APG75691.1 hypothetical protein 1 [Beihai sobemo-like virus 21]